MEVLISLPKMGSGCNLGSLENTLFQKVSGIPLLLRVMATASKSGATSILLVHPRDLPANWLQSRLQSPLGSSVPIRMISLDEAFDVDNPAHWRLIENELEPRFLWLPWNYVTVKKTLGALIRAGEDVAQGLGFAPRQKGSGQECSPAQNRLEMPAVVVSTELLTTGRGSLSRFLENPALGSIPSPQVSGVAVVSGQTKREAEDLLVRGSGKESDGIYSNFNRRLCGPTVRWLARTPVTANMITWAGLPLVVLSGYLYAQGHWSAYALAGLVYFISVEFDEMDGMMARIKFQDSPFGCWLETAVDYASFLFLWSGMSIGLYRQYGKIWLVLGALTLAVNVMIFFVLAWQRKVFTPSDQPHEYRNRFYGRLEADSGSFISRAIRKVVFIAKKGVMCHYILLFSVLGLLPVLFVLAVTGSILTLMIAFYMNQLLRLPAQVEIHSTEPAQVGGNS